MLVEAARVFAPLRVGERTHTHTHKKRIEKKRNDIDNTRGIQRLILFLRTRLLLLIAESRRLLIYTGVSLRELTLH